MIDKTKWIERGFILDTPAGMFPNLLERFKGTPARLEEAVRDLPSDILTKRDGDSWSIQEHAGHLLDLEELTENRIKEFLSGAEELTPADMSNKKTYEEDHNSKNIEDILSELRRRRTAMAESIENLDEATITREALHPRLKKTMRLIDLVYFNSEHDDHHLASITALKKRFKS